MESAAYMRERESFLAASVRCSRAAGGIQASLSDTLLRLNYCWKRR